MTEDPREFGLSAADLHDAADRLYDPADTRLDPIEWTPEAQARYGRIRSRLRGLADAIGTEPEANPAADHDRPDIAAMRAALDACRADLTAGRPGAAHDVVAAAIDAGTCPACMTAAAIGFAWAVAASLTGESFVSQSLGHRLVNAVDATQAELDASAN